MLAGRFVEALRSPLAHRLLQQAAAPLHHGDEGRAEDVAAYFGAVEQTATVLIAEQVQLPCFYQSSGPLLFKPHSYESVLAIKLEYSPKNEAAMFAGRRQRRSFDSPCYRRCGAVPLLAGQPDGVRHILCQGQHVLYRPHALQQTTIFRSQAFQSCSLPRVFCLDLYLRPCSCLLLPQYSTVFGRPAPDTPESPANLFAQPQPTSAQLAEAAAAQQADLGADATSAANHWAMQRLAASGEEVEGLCSLPQYLLLARTLLLPPLGADQGVSSSLLVLLFSTNLCFSGKVPGADLTCLCNCFGLAALPGFT